MRSVYSIVPLRPPERPRRSTRSARASLAAACCALLLLLVATPAPIAAHAELVTSSPGANASLIEPPDEVVLTFTEPIDPATAVVEVLDPEARPVAGIGEAKVDASATELTVGLPALEPGTYTVTYQVVSAVDGHATAGILAFLVDPSGTEAPPVAGPGSSSPSVDTATVVARWVALSAILVALGALVMWWNAARPALADAGSSDLRPPWLLIGTAACLGFVSLAVYLALAARPIVAATGGGHGGHAGAGFPLDFAAPFGWTPFAIAMRVALVGAVATFAFAAVRWFALQGRTAPPGDDRGRAAVAAVLLGLTLAGMSMAGHAAATGGPAFGAVDWAHLVSVAAWLGGLPAAVVLARRASRDRPGMMRSILRRHGRVAMVAGPVTALTGLANAPLVIGSGRDLVASDYGNLLLAKVLLLSVAIGIGAVNHLALRSVTRARLRLLLGAEVAVAVVAVLAAATMVTIQPAAARQPVLVGPPDAPAHLFGTAGESRVHVAVTLPAPGRQTYQAVIADTDTGAPATDVQRVYATFVPPQSSRLPPQRVELAAAETPGLYGATGAYTPVEGDWTLEVTVRRVGVLDEEVAFELPVATPEPPERAPPPDTGVGTPAALGALWSVLPDGAAGWLPAIVALVALLLGAWWARRPRSPRWLPAARMALAGLLAVAVVGAGSRALVTAANRPPPDVIEANPIVADAESVELGERLYLANCASCHGANGDGDGALATMPRPAALADRVRSASDGELAYRIAVGVAGTPMPAFAGILTAEERWHLVNYLHDRWGGP